MSVPGYQQPQTPGAPAYQPPHDPTAVIGSRTLAWIVDAILWLALSTLLGPFGFLGEYEKLDSDAFASYGDACEQLEDSPDVDAAVCVELGDRAYWTSGSDAAIQAVASIAYFVLVYVVWQGLTGLTVGKALLGLRTVDQQGQQPGMGKALVRSLLWVVDGQPCGIPAVGFITGLTSSGHRRVGDMAAKTFVVRKADFGRPVVVPGLTAPGYGAPGTYPPQAGTGYPAAPPSGPWTATQAPPAGGQPWGAPQQPTAPGPPTTTARPEPPQTTAAAQKPPPPATPPEDEVKDEAATAEFPSEELKEPSAEEPAGATEPDEAQSEPETQPETMPEEPAAPEAKPAEAPRQPEYNPQWDAARGTYIQWDPNRGHWLQWDDRSKQWKPI